MEGLKPPVIYHHQLANFNRKSMILRFRLHEQGKEFIKILIIGNFKHEQERKTIQKTS
jgi:hypothetical protein